MSIELDFKRGYLWVNWFASKQKMINMNWRKLLWI
jgi:hypothetical protein